MCREDDKVRHRKRKEVRITGKAQRGLFFESWSEMQLHISPSLRYITVLPGKGFREYFKVKIGSRRLSYRMVFYSLLVLTFLLRFIFVLTAMDTIDGESRCSTIGKLFLVYIPFHVLAVSSPSGYLLLTISLIYFFFF